MNVNPMLRRGAEFFSVPISAADLAAVAGAATANNPITFTVLTAKAGRLVRLIGGWLEIAFTRTAAGGSPQTSTQISVGDVNSPNRFVGPFELNAGGAPAPTVPGGIQPVAAPVPIIYNADTAIIVTIAAQAALKIGDLDTGQLWLKFELMDIKDALGANFDGNA